jgi:hypothetical protein
LDKTSIRQTFSGHATCWQVFCLLKIGHGYFATACKAGHQNDEPISIISHLLLAIKVIQ